jgi:hypothetical protein
MSQHADDKENRRRLPAAPMGVLLMEMHNHLRLKSLLTTTTRPPMVMIFLSLTWMLRQLRRRTLSSVTS